MSKQNRAGFTLVELLVVITIIGMLIGLLANAVIGAREAARQTQCGNNQKELHTAIYSYELSKNRYPGYLNSNGRTWPMVIFKGLGLAKMHREFLTGGGGETGGQALESEVRQFICPVDNLGEDGSLSYVVNTGQLGPDEPAKAYGIFHDLSNPTSGGQMVRVSSADIRDGADQTLLIAERGNDLNQTGESGATARQWQTAGDDPEQQLGFYWGGTDGNVRNHIRSSHPDISVVTFCGGNQKKLFLGIEYRVYAMLMTPDGTKAGQTGVLQEGDY